MKDYPPADFRVHTRDIFETDCLECGEVLLCFRGDSVAAVFGKSSGSDAETELKGLLCERCSRGQEEDAK